MLIASDRRRPNPGEYIKLSIPRRFVNHGPFLEPDFYPCEGARIEPCKEVSCDLCKHVHPTKLLYPPWDGRNWTIRQNIYCFIKNIVYLIYCAVM